MEIYFNEEKLDFKLEDEKNLGDILRGLENWVSENKGVIQKVLVNKKSIPLENESYVFERDISSIEEIEVFSSTHTELAVETITTLGEYILMILNEYMKEESIKSYDSIMEGLKLIHEGTTGCLRVLGIKDLVVINNKGKSLRDILLEIDQFILMYEKRYIDSNGMVTLEALLNQLLHSIPKLLKWTAVKNKGIDKIHESSFIKELFEDIHTICSGSLDKFAQIGRDLQIGNDLQAMNNLCYLTEILDEVIILLKIAQDIFKIDFKQLTGLRKNIDDLFQNITSRLKEVEDAFKEGDMVTVGDVMEYEVEPLFESMVGVIGKINNFLR